MAKGKKEPVKQRRITLDIPEALHATAKAEALRQQCTLRELVIKGLEQVVPLKVKMVVSYDKGGK